jgi:hypothetical protein
MQEVAGALQRSLLVAERLELGDGDRRLRERGSGGDALLREPGALRLPLLLRALQASEPLGNIVVRPLGEQRLQRVALPG